MRMYQNPVEAFKEIQRDLWEMGTVVKGSTVQATRTVGQEGWTKELMGYSYSIPLRQPVYEEFKSLALEAGFSTEEAESLYQYTLTEFSDRMSGQPMNPGNAYQWRAKYWEKYLQDGRFAYTYPERMAYPVHLAIAELRHNLTSRQAIISIWDRGQDTYRIGGKLRVPCSMHYQLLVRSVDDRPQLSVIYSMRSCDIYTHFIVDQMLANMLGVAAASMLGVDRGRLIHQFGSLHAFYNDLVKRGIF